MLLRPSVSALRSFRLSFSTTPNPSPQKAKNFMVSTPIFYVNAAPHLGHLYSTLLADVLARWNRIRNVSSDVDLSSGSTLFVTGTDEHGLKIQQSAEKSNLDCGKFVDLNSFSFKSLFEDAKISYDRFIRTTENSHCKMVESVWTELVNRGYIYKGNFEGWYCASEEAFLEEKNIFEKEKENGEVVHLSVETKQPVVWTSEVNYMFKLSEFQERIIKWLEEEKPITPEHKLSEIIGILKSEKLRDISVSRCSSRIKWAISVPNDSSQTVYVWLDALLNYLTAANSIAPSFIQHQTDSESSASEENRESEECDIKSLAKTGYWPADYQIVGKDILKFHSVYWPAFLMALNLPLPKKIVAHGHWMLKNSRMSKSGKNAVNPVDLMTKYGTDAVRYYLISEGGIETDVSFSEDTLVARLKADLAGGVGTLFSRIITFLGPEKVIPRIDDLAAIAQPELYSLHEKVDEYFAEAKFSRGIQLVMDQVKNTNKYVNDMKPWNLPIESQECKVIVYRTLEVLRVAAILLQPVVPEKTSLFLDALGIAPEDRMMRHTTSYRQFGGRVYPELVQSALFSLDGIDGMKSVTRKEKQEKTNEAKAPIDFGLRSSGGISSIPHSTAL